MSKPLILVKHSLPEIERDRPARGWHLSEEGRLRAERLAERLSLYHVEIILSSDESKAMETAQIIALNHGCQFHVVQGLHEHDRTHVPYLSSQAFETAVQELFSQPDRLVFGGETANQAHERFSRTVFSLQEKYENQGVLIISHGTVISLFVSRLTGTSDVELWKKLGLPSFVVLDIQLKHLIAIENL